MKPTKKSNTYIIALLTVTAFAGALLAKVAPMEEGHGFSAVFNEKPKEEVKPTETSESKKEPKKEKKLTYVEQVNENLTQGKYANRMPIKLLLQTDDRWKATTYGIGNPDGDTLEINGCAILSLAMVATYLDQKDQTPQDILNWSKNDYYLEGEGTAWAAFSDFAMVKGYQFQDLETDITAVEEHLKQNHPVIISVKPGLFTETGHIMVLSGTNNGKFWVNDPNDTEEKGHSTKEFTADELLNEALNFWVIYK
ncbi:C39 family peptidase [Enterococcus sp. AZ192]|uniref:C39 family peptidase n=1 Tax=unclassified Enterococcus TaxID=2608891 RepID=UPI003D2DFCE8